MKTPKLLIAMLIVIAFALFSLNSYAQDSTKKHTPEMRAKKMTDKMKTSLNLTDEQYSKIYDLNLKQVKWKQDNKKNNPSKTELKNKKEEYHNEMEKVLNKEQMDKYKTHKKKHHKSWFKRTFGIF